MKLKVISLIAVVVLIVLAIVYLEGQKNSPSQNGNKPTEVPFNEEQILTSSEEVSAESSVPIDSNAYLAKISQYPRAKELVSPEGYFNVEKNITLADYVGKNVILLDFWTYSCINCQRTTPYLNTWYEKYQDDGLVIIGVHTPEFDFEKDYDNVAKAIEKFGIKYPVVQDNDFATWQAYNNRYWPRKYLIDIDGFIVYDHIGEGGYGETEAKLQYLLEERKRRFDTTNSVEKGTSLVNTDDPEFIKIQTPELYLGYGFDREQLGNSEGLDPDSVVTYALPPTLKVGSFYLEGMWLNNKDNMQSVGDSKIVVPYNARQVNIVASASETRTTSVYIDGLFVHNISINDSTLYTLYSASEYGKHLLELRAEDGLKVYTFTFG